MTDLNSIIKKFENYLLAQKKSRNTVREYKSLVKNFLEFEKKDPIHISIEDVEKYREYLVIEKHASKQTIYLAMKALQSFFKFLNRSDLSKIPAPKRSKKLPVYLNSLEMNRLIDASSKNKRDHAIIVLLAYSGMRVSELCSLDIEDIDFIEGIVRIRSGKGDKDRIVVIDKKAIETLKDYLHDEKRFSGPLFLSQKNSRITSVQVERLIRKYSKLAGISKHVTPHVIRHTFATTLLKNGADIRFIQQLLGHSSISTTEIYTHVDESTLREIYEKTKPNY